MLNDEVQSILDETVVVALNDSYTPPQLPRGPSLTPSGDSPAVSDPDFQDADEYYHLVSLKLLGDQIAYRVGQTLFIANETRCPAANLKLEKPMPKN